MRWIVIAGLVLCSQVSQAAGAGWSWTQVRARFEAIEGSIVIHDRHVERLKTQLQTPFAWPRLSFSYDREQFIKGGSLDGVAQNNFLLGISLPFFQVGPAKHLLRSRLLFAKARGKVFRARRQLWLARRLLAYRYHTDADRQLSQLLLHLQRFKQIVDRRKKQGVASTYEVNAASLELSRVKSQAALHRMKRDLLVAGLTAALGLAKLPVFDRLRLASPGLATLQADCLKHNPEIARLEAMANKTRGRIKLAASKRLPVFNLRAGYTFLESQRIQHGYLIGFSIGIPVFDWRRREVSGHRATLKLTLAKLRAYRTQTLRRLSHWHRQLARIALQAKQPSEGILKAKMDLAIQAFEKAGNARRFLDTARAVYELKRVVLDRQYTIDQSKVMLYELVGKNYIQ